MKLATKGIDEVYVNPDNPRVIKDHKFQQLKEGIRKFPKMMKIRRIVIDKKGMILGGEKRYLAAKELGWKKIDVIIADEFTTKEKLAFILKDNDHAGEYNEAMLATWDEDLLLDNGFDHLVNIPETEKKVKAKGKRQVTFRFSESDYLKVMGAMRDQMDETGITSEEKFLKHLLKI